MSLLEYLWFNVHLQEEEESQNDFLHSYHARVQLLTLMKEALVEIAGSLRPTHGSDVDIESFNQIQIY